MDKEYRAFMLNSAREFMRGCTRRSYWYVLPFEPESRQFVGSYWCDYGRSDKNRRARVAADMIGEGCGALIVQGREIA